MPTAEENCRLRRRESRCSPAGTRWDRKPYLVSCPLLTPQTFLCADTSEMCSETRGAHRGVWCSKGTPLMEAELFAAERCRPAPDGRALLCAANYAREIQGITASQNLPDARNRAPVSPRFAARPKGVAAQRRVWGSQEGAREPCGALAPFCPRRRAAVCRFTQSRNSRFSYKTNRLSPSSMVYYS